MRIAQGIKGIRKFKEENKAGWHVFINGAYIGYNGATVLDIFGSLGAEFVFTQWAGNTLHFTVSA